ncbi:MAG: hypothetical protein IPM47_07160 [Sphingobacteriales bacterium]|nr:MAG: hypothetical protein IPM47_07160 [Sphingobacteriales bacterium]
MTTNTPQSDKSTPTSSIYTKLLLFSVMVGLATGMLHVTGKLGDYPGFAWLCYGFFTLLSFFIIYLIAMTNQSSTPGRAVNLVLGAMGLKFLFSILMVLVYILAANPQTVYFIIPFFVLYTLYTVVETRFLMMVVNTKNKKN